MKSYFKSSGSNKPTLRRSQCVTTFGVGAIADLPNVSVMICSIDKWDSKACETLEDPRLQEKLSAAYFLMPPDTEKSDTGIRAVIFPRWLRCRKCKSLKHLAEWKDLAEKNRKDWNFDNKPFCYLCGLTLIPSRFIVACVKGHADDFPYVEWAHGGNEICAKPELIYEESGKTTSLSGIVIRCLSCKKFQNMGRSFTREYLASIARCKGVKPWAKEWTGTCGQELVTLQRGGTNAHFPIIKSSILIPPYSAESMKSLIRETDAWRAVESDTDAIDVKVIDYIAKRIATDLQEREDKIKPLINEMLGETEVSEKQKKSEEDYRHEEYSALLGGGSKSHSDSFLVELQDPAKYELPHVKNIVLAKKLREIRVQTGFSRIRPPQRIDESGAVVSDLEAVEIVPVTENKKIRWLPGYEVKGEGIFIQFQTEELQKWAESKFVKNRTARLIERSIMHPDMFAMFSPLTPEFILLHTFSHLLIKQLSFECGYSSSALRERIYCSSDQKKRQMTGVLIYTAEGDSDGTLGGLVKQGQADLFNRTLIQTFLSAQWCSCDPLCIESDGQGYQALNLAACHSCTLLPETSCELMNRYLDRGVLIGTIENPESGFFSGWLKNK